MILAIDLGNTNIVFGLFSGRKLVRQWRRPSDRYKKVPQDFHCDGVVVASVVPALNAGLRRAVRRRLGLRPHFVTAQNISGLKVHLKNKHEIGADRVVDALAAWRFYGGPAIVVDFGTATTFDLLSADGEYLGGAIAPGIMLARDALYERAAKLPHIEITAPASVVGKDTVSAMKSGLVYGYVAMVEGMVSRIKSQVQDSRSKINPKPKIRVIATGGLAKLICKYTKVVDTIDPQLTLKGLQLIGEELYG
jgi:type III pantothenate kinase